jgi:plasmid stability protein
MARRVALVKTAPERKKPGQPCATDRNKRNSSEAIDSVTLELHIVPILGIAPWASPFLSKALFTPKNQNIAGSIRQYCCVCSETDAFRIYSGSQSGSAEAAMGINISIKNVPEEKVAQLKARAKRNHRSLQGELLALIEESLAAKTAERKSMTLGEYVEEGLRMGLSTPAQAAQWIREDRDSR